MLVILILNFFPYVCGGAEQVQPWDILLANCPISPMVNSPNDGAAKKTTAVDIFLSVDRFVEIDDVEESFTILAILWVGWTVPCVAEVAAHHLPNMSVLSRVDPELFWWPKVLHRNSMTKVELSTDSFSKGLVIALPTGYFSAMIAGSFSSYNSNFNLYKFPFDKQTCSLIILMQDVEPGEYVTLARFNFRDFSTNYMPESSGWRKIDHNVTMEPTVFGYQIIFTITFERRPDYYMTNLFAPGLILSILELGSFLVPAPEPDRPAFACAIMLSIFVTRDQMLANLPKTPQPIIAGFYVLSEIVFAMACAIYSAGMCSYIALFENSAMRKTRIFGIKHYCLIDFVAFVIATISLLLLNVVTGYIIVEP